MRKTAACKGRTVLRVQRQVCATVAKLVAGGGACGRTSGVVEEEEWRAAKLASKGEKED